MERRPTRSSGPVVVGQPQSIPPAIPAKPKSLRSRLSMGVSKYASQTFEKLVTQTASPSRREETKDSNASAAASPSSAGSEVKEEPSPVSTTSSSSSSSTDSRPSDVDSPAMKAEVSEGKRDGAGLGAAPVDDAVAAPVAGPGFRRFDAVLSRVGGCSNVSGCRLLTLLSQACSKRWRTSPAFTRCTSPSSSSSCSSSGPST